MHALEIAHGDDGAGEHPRMRRLTEPVMNGNETRLRSHGGARFLKSPRPCLPGLTQVKPGGGRGGRREFLSDGFREINALPTMDHGVRAYVAVNAARAFDLPQILAVAPTWN
jgi:hypothetical protein